MTIAYSLRSCLQISVDPSKSVQPIDTSKPSTSPSPGKQTPAEASQPDKTSSSMQDVQPSENEVPEAVTKTEKLGQPYSSTAQAETQGSMKSPVVDKGETPAAGVTNLAAVVTDLSTEDPSKCTPAITDADVTADIGNAADQAESKSNAPTGDASNSKVDAAPKGALDTKLDVDVSKKDLAASDALKDESVTQDAAGDKSSEDTSSQQSATASTRIPSGKKTADSGTQGNL